jgi:hypothetical protein
MNFYANNENAIEWLRDQDRITVTLSDRKMINKVKRIAEKHPQDVEILALPENNGGYLYARLPLVCLNLRDPGRRTEKTPEQIEAMRERMNRLRDNQNMRAWADGTH